MRIRNSHLAWGIAFGIASLGGCPWPQFQAGFEHFEYEQHSALGFCPTLDAVTQATIDRQPDGSYWVELSVIEAGDPNTDDCSQLLGVLGTDCAVLHELPGRQMTNGEVARMLAVFALIELREACFPELVCVDPCRIDVYQWDDWSIQAGVAGCVYGCSQMLASEEIAEIQALLEELRQTSEE